MFDRWSVKSQPNSKRLGNLVRRDDRSFVVHTNSLVCRQRARDQHGRPLQSQRRVNGFVTVRLQVTPPFCDVCHISKWTGSQDVCTDALTTELTESLPTVHVNAAFPARMEGLLLLIWTDFVHQGEWSAFSDTEDECDSSIKRRTALSDPPGILLDKYPSRGPCSDGVHTVRVASVRACVCPAEREVTVVWQMMCHLAMDKKHTLQFTFHLVQRLKTITLRDLTPGILNRHPSFYCVPDMTMRTPLHIDYVCLEFVLSYFVADCFGSFHMDVDSRFQESMCHSIVLQTLHQEEGELELNLIFVLNQPFQPLLNFLLIT
ncbi:hypothetical protein J6590_008144 [Homalodisca vitripennis]|nr:hypothetical protein J6590_008144 [Homalodisca vitripennis]